MSIILKALQRAERERQYAHREGSAPLFWSAAGRARRPRPIAALALAFALAAGAGAWSLGGRGKQAPERSDREAAGAGPQRTAAPPTANAAPRAPFPPKDGSGRAGVLSSLPAPAAELRAAPPETLMISGMTARTASFQGLPEEKKAAAAALPPATPAPEGRIREGRQPGAALPAQAPAEARKVSEPEDLDEAIAHFLAALRVRPRHAATHAALGRLYARKGSYILAINELRMAAELAPGDSESLYALSVLYARLGNAKAARDYLAQTIRKDPDARQRALGEREFSRFLADPPFRALLGVTAENRRP